jgi:ATP-dependent DNA ligase
LLLKTLKTNKTITEKGYQNGVVFDGELYQLDNETGRPKSRQLSNGVATKLIKQTASEEEQKDIGITVWDCIPYAEFQKGLHKTEYQHRLNDLKFALEENSEIEHIALVESKLCYNEQEVFDTAAKLIANGEEGIIVKTVDGPYENKRSKFALKIKDVLEADLKVVAIQEGTGKYKGKIGALLCESGDGNVKVSVGSGLTDEQRSLPESDYIGKIISVKYNAKIPNYDKSGETLFLPRFVEIRLDKDSADIL